MIIFFCCACVPGKQLKLTNTIWANTKLTLKLIGTIYSVRRAGNKKTRDAEQNRIAASY